MRICHSEPSPQKLPTFDELVELFKQSPDAFDRLKHNMCEEAIRSASESMQPRLRAQQSHIDLVISQCKNPNHVNVTLMRELTQQIEKFRHALEGDVKLTHEADIIPFKRKDDEWR